VISAPASGGSTPVGSVYGPPVEVRSRELAEPFTTKDGSTIRVLLDAALGGAVEQSLAEASLEAGQATDRHYHAQTEEIYVLLDGEAEMEVEGDRQRVGPGDAILIPAGAWHQIRAGEAPLRFLCCCAPPYSDADTFFGP
jgi:mannose-6-phosphate isomerase-like protein (cupin superfamily)